MQIEFNTRNEAEALKVTKTVFLNALPHIIAYLLWQFSQYKDHLWVFIHFTVDCMMVRHVGGRGWKEATVIRPHQTSTIAPLRKEKASQEGLLKKKVSRHREDNRGRTFADGFI